MALAAVAIKMLRRECERRRRFRSIESSDVASAFRLTVRRSIRLQPDQMITTVQPDVTGDSASTSSWVLAGRRGRCGRERVRRSYPVALASTMVWSDADLSRGTKRQSYRAATRTR